MYSEHCLFICILSTFRNSGNIICFRSKMLTIFQVIVFSHLLYFHLQSLWRSHVPWASIRLTGIYPSSLSDEGQHLIEYRHSPYIKQTRSWHYWVNGGGQTHAESKLILEALKVGMIYSVWSELLHYRWSNQHLRISKELNKCCFVLGSITKINNKFASCINI